MPAYRVEIEARPELTDAHAAQTLAHMRQWLGITAAAARSRKVFLLDLAIDDTGAREVLAALMDPVVEIGAVGALPDAVPEWDARYGAPWVVTVGYLPGVTDPVGASARRAAADRLGRPLLGQVYSARTHRLWGLDRAQVERVARELLHNPLIERVAIEAPPRSATVQVPRAGQERRGTVRTVPVRDADDARLLSLSSEGLLALNLAEMQAIAAHFRVLGRDPTDGELECLAQTWSEHCKHKIFAAPIDYVDPEGHARRVDGLFRTYIRGATDAVAQARAGVDGDAPFLVSVFHDNAGVVRFTAEDHLVYKVETHNSPSALDPYGGAMTGIVGVNRDSFGTGIGADLLTNVWGYCFGDPRDDRPLPPGLLHPRRIRDGVHRGVIDGGNQSGIPWSRGFELFDERYLGKPLVFCGTVAVMPCESAGHPTHVKRTAVGDAIVMVGGRIGKDGIHGATFSSVELDESSPVQAVQIGDPITQKMMFDMLTEARDRGLITGMTDNGAGGLSSSVGEMAELTGGARIDLAKAPLKYPGLEPWEILISEAQERMTVSVAPAALAAFLELARQREVEATVLGTFTDSGRFEVSYGDTRLVDLELAFLHGGCPRTPLQARWSPPLAPAAASAPGTAAAGIAAQLLALLRTPSLASAEPRGRQYDHEVKGLSVVKPYVGVRRDVPATATVMRARHGRDEGVVLGEGVHPWLSDLDTYAMAQACVDEAVRRVLCAGARLDRIAALDNFCWPDPIVSAKTPDGEHKLAQLVRCCEGLYAACVGYGVPLISGKDSMKNDANLGGRKISIPPTLLVSAIGQIERVQRALDLRPRASGERLFVLGATFAELGGSAAARTFGWADGRLGEAARVVPRTDVARHAARYAAVAAARDAGLVRASHAVGRGGLAVALAHMAMACEFDLRVDLRPALARADEPPAAVDGGTGAAPAPCGPEDGAAATSIAAFAESTGRIVFTARPEHVAALEAALGAHGLREIGDVAAAAGTPALRFAHGADGDDGPCELAIAAVRAAFEETLHDL